MKKQFLINLGLSLLSGFLLSLGWTQLGIGWIVFFAFVPLLIIIDRLKSEGKKNSAAIFTAYSFISFITWNLASTWWIYHSTIPGAIFVFLMTTVCMSTVMFLSYRNFEKSVRSLAYLALVVNWLAFEYLLMHSEFSWPWLCLGNSFANNISIIQWYEYTGTYGGSLWILIVNIIIYEIYRMILSKHEKRKIYRRVSVLAIIVFVPILFSTYRYNTYKEFSAPVDIVIVQPNIDPYSEKFVMKITKQIDIITDAAIVNADDKVDYFIAPETALPNGIWENEIENHFCIEQIRQFLLEYPDSKFIIGATTRVKYSKGLGKSETAVESGQDGDYFDLFNSSLQIDTSTFVDIYHKSRLVPGVEVMPYPKILGFLSGMMLDLGGINGSHGTQEERDVFNNDRLDIYAGVPVCYESEYGEFITEFVSKGANILFLITNDGWWGDTPGYKQHINYARLRAVETRRSIARSANTGISCFINQRGDVVKKLGWWQRGSIREHLNANDKITFYVLYGDFLARMAILIAAIILILQLGEWIRARFKR